MYRQISPDFSIIEADNYVTKAIFIGVTVLMYDLPEVENIGFKLSTSLIFL